MQQHDELAVGIVERVADREGADPIELSPPLHEVVDTDALESLFGPRNAGGADLSVTFTYRGYDVRIDGPGTIHVEESRSDTVLGRTDR